MSTQTDISQRRPASFADFVGQEHIKKVLSTAIRSSSTTGKPIGHILFSGRSGFGKTTLAKITSEMLGSKLHIITGYAFSKPSELISLLNMIREGDILFIDEIHRLKAPIEEVLYTAMEDYCIDMIMPDGHHLRLPVEPFTLIGATTKLESLAAPLKNRFIYHFHMNPYSEEEKKLIILRYLRVYGIESSDQLLEMMSQNISGVPRRIANFCHQLKDYLIDTEGDKEFHQLDTLIRDDFRNRASLEVGGLTPLHKRYLNILEEFPHQAIGLKTLAVKIGMNEKAVENDIEPLLFELHKIIKTPRGRMLNDEHGNNSASLF